jgi:hypothetical protein
MRASAPLLALTIALSGVAATAIPPAPLKVFGHKIPDTDAICAALVYAWELEQRGIPAQAYRLGELNRETEYVLQSLGLEPPPMLEQLESDAAVAIVDTNNPAELPEGVEKVSIHSIIDHHKMSGLTTKSPLELDVRPLCSTGSILYSRCKAAGRTPTAKIAGLMLSCILSDSLEFRSPTTTAVDKELALELAQIAGIDLHAHAEAMLDAKAEISHLSPEAVVMMDSKVRNVARRHAGPRRRSRRPGASVGSWRSRLRACQIRAAPRLRPPRAVQDPVVSHSWGLRVRASGIHHRRAQAANLGSGDNEAAEGPAAAGRAGGRTAAAHRRAAPGRRPALRRRHSERGGRLLARIADGHRDRQRLVGHAAAPGWHVRAARGALTEEADHPRPRGRCRPRRLQGARLCLRRAGRLRPSGAVSAELLKVRS